MVSDKQHAFVWKGKGYNLAEFEEVYNEVVRRKREAEKVLRRKNRSYYDVFVFGV